MKSRYERLLVLFVVIATNLFSQQTSFNRIQEKIFTVHCIICHSGAFPAASQNLAAPGTYQRIVNITPTNIDAATDGFKKIYPFKSDSSFMYLKVTGNLTKFGYGAQMPKFAAPLSMGKIEFMRRWIVAGAKETDDDIDTTLLEDPLIIASQTSLARTFRVSLTNPYSSGTPLRVISEEAGEVRLSIYNASGSKIQARPFHVRANQWKEIGLEEESQQPLTPGVYLIQLRQNNKILKSRLTLIR